MDVDSFLQALHALEERHDPAPLLALFAPTAEVWSPRYAAPLRGPEGVAQFWRDYRAAFREVRTVPLTIIQEALRAAVEWTATGTTTETGRRLTYQGATILEWRGNRLQRLASYFDARLFLPVPPHVEPAVRPLTPPR